MPAQLRMHDVDPAGAEQQARRIAAELTGIVGAPVYLRGAGVPVGVRTGVAVFPNEGGDFDEPLRATALGRYSNRAAPAVRS